MWWAGELFPNQELDEAVAPLCVVCLEVGWPLRSLDRFPKFRNGGPIAIFELQTLRELVLEQVMRDTGGRAALARIR